MTKKALLSAVREIDEIVDRWVKLRREIDKRETELRELTPPIKEVLKKSPNREKQFGPHLLFLTKDTERTNFDRAKAIEGLGSEALAPFLSKNMVEGYIKMK